MGFLQGIVGKVVTALLGLIVLVAAVSWWRADPSERHAVLSDAGRIGAWLGLVVLVPWVAFAVIGRVAKLESNAAGGVLVAALTGIELLVVAWLFHWSVSGPTAWTFLILGGLAAGLYNLLACDWIAEKVAP